MYNDSALDRIHWIEKLQELDFSLTDIREFLIGFRSQDTGPAAMDVLRAFYVDKLAETQVAIDRMLSLQNELKASLAYLNVCQDCSSAHAQSACGTCDNTDHSDGPPVMVSAIATSV
jgi:DNA-binding transcriptional MerR regulator